MVKLITDHFHKTIGVIGFGACWPSPVMRVHYGDKHFGVALGFDVPDTCGWRPPVAFCCFACDAAGEIRLGSESKDGLKPLKGKAD